MINIKNKQKQKNNCLKPSEFIQKKGDSAEEVTLGKNIKE